jgi:hypothetical protein
LAIQFKHSQNVQYKLGEGVKNKVKMNTFTVAAVIINYTMSTIRKGEIRDLDQKLQIKIIKKRVMVLGQ